MASLNHSRYSLPKPLSWLRVVQIGFGALTILTSIFALAFPGFTYISVVWVLAVVLFFVGIEEIIVGIFSRKEYRWPTIGLGILVLIFAAIAMSFPVAAAITIVIFIGIEFLINGIARIVEGFSGRHSLISRVLPIGVGTMAVVITAPLLISPLFFSSIPAETIIGIGLLVTGPQMLYASQRKICRNSWPLIFNILYVVQYLLMNHQENKHQPSKQPSENYHSGDNCRLHTEVIYCK
jgi:membrane protein HdeD